MPPTAVGSKAFVGPTWVPIAHVVSPLSTPSMAVAGPAPNDRMRLFWMFMFASPRNAGFGSPASPAAQSGSLTLQMATLPFTVPFTCTPTGDHACTNVLLRTCIRAGR